MNFKEVKNSDPTSYLHDLINALEKSNRNHYIWPSIGINYNLEFEME